MSIKGTINTFSSGGDLLQAAKQLFTELGYESERLIDIQMTSREFVARPYDEPIMTKSTKRFLQAATKITLLFQIQGSDIFRHLSNSPVFHDLGFSKNDEDGILFVNVELKYDDFMRFDYYCFAREVGKRLTQSAFIVFSNTEYIALAFCRKRPHKSQPWQTVIEETGSTAGFASRHNDWIDFVEVMSLSNVLKAMQAVGASGVGDFCRMLMCAFPENSGFNEWLRARRRKSASYREYGVCEGRHITLEEARTCGCIDTSMPLPPWGPPYGKL